MYLTYDDFSAAFLDKIKEYDFIDMASSVRTNLVDGYMKRAIAEFDEVCEYNLLAGMNDDAREFNSEVPTERADEILDIVSDGMVVQWLRPALNHQMNLENVLSTKDFVTFSPAELLKQIRTVYDEAKKNYTFRTRDYSYRHGDLTTLHL